MLRNQFRPPQSSARQSTPEAATDDPEAINYERLAERELEAAALARGAQARIAHLDLAAAYAHAAEKCRS
jgi:hypothetical protein